MYPQNSHNDPTGPSPSSESNPYPSEEATTPSTSPAPQPADAWPSRAETSGDIEPATQPSAPIVAQVDTDEPTPQATPAEYYVTTATGSQTGTRRRKPWIVAVMVASVLLVLGGIGAAAYALYENPDKVMADSMGQLVTAKSLSFTGTGNIKADTTNISASYDGISAQRAVSLHSKVTFGAGAATLTAEGNVIADKDGNYYLKVANVKDIMSSFLSQIPAEAQSSVNQIIAKLDNKWIKIAASDLPSSTDGSKAQECFRTALGKVQSDVSYRKDIEDLYGKQRFVVVKQKLGLKDMNVGYRLAIDVAKERSFIDGMTATKLYGDLKKCDSTFNLDGMKLDANAKSLPEFELWSNVLTHQPKRIAVMNPSTDTSTTYNFTLNPVLGSLAKIDIPTDAIDIKQLQGELLGLSMAAYGGIATRADTSKNQANAVMLEKKVETYNADTAAGNGSYPTFAQILSATGLSEVPADVKAVMVSRTAAKGGEIGLVPCKNAAKGGTISYIDETTNEVKTIPYGTC